MIMTVCSEYISDVIYSCAQQWLARTLYNIEYIQGPQ